MPKGGAGLFNDKFAWSGFGPRQRPRRGEIQGRISSASWENLAKISFSTVGSLFSDRLLGQDTTISVDW